jgi:PilZ domain
MSQLEVNTPRRSARVFHRMRVQANGRAHNGKKFRETCETVVVNAHGALLVLKHEIDNGEMLVLTNPETQEEQECRVVYQGEPGERGQRVGVEFLTPAPHFWGVEFGEQAPSAGDNASTVH